MNLFDLFVKIGVKDEASDRISQIKATTVAAGQLMANAAMAAGSALVNLGKQALEGYANYEQLAGGVETLFKESAGTIQDYADRAYQTAGLSANEYMETVTSFSASLIQSLGGDTAAAAEYADRAIVSMSDNANKMGTDMSMIQNAYQGFAKQNYTLLDNLKLGYGGTKEEMQRLLEDAEKLSGIEYDISSYADIVDAIHVVQTEMGITGTTAKEASETIGGSVNAMKAAWQNLTVGFADENANIDQLLGEFLASVETAAGNLLPAVGRVISSIFSTIKENGPDMIVSGAELLGNLAVGAINAIPDIVMSIPEIVSSIVDAFAESGPKFEEIGAAIVEGIWTGIKNLSGWLGEKVTGFLDSLFRTAEENEEINSPSKKWARIGAYDAQGFVNGWEREYSSIKNNITSGLDFGTARVGLSSSGVGQISNGIASGIINNSSAERNIVINLTTTLDGEVLTRKMYSYNERESLRRGVSFV